MALAVLAGALAVGPAVASAGGGRLAPVQERYEPGQKATMVGYTAAEVPEDRFYAYLRPTGDAPGVRLLYSDVYVGELVVRPTGHGGYLQLRVSATFDIPDDLGPGDYDLIYCDDPCSGRRVGDLLPSPLSIGVDPARRVVREWAQDEPEIANLAPGALLVGPGFQTTATEVRAGPARPATAPAPPVTAAAAAPLTPTIASAATPPARDDMAWPLPTALVLASAAATALVLSRRRPAPATGRWVAAAGGSSGAASARRG